MKKMFILAVPILLLMGSVLFALTLAKATVEELTMESSCVVHGMIQQVECRWENQEQGTIATFITVKVLETLKGENESRVVVKQQGGQIGEWGDVIPGTPAVNKGDEVILFLVKNQDSYEIHSIALGLFRIYSDNSGQKMAINDLQNVNLIDPQTGIEIKGDEANTAFVLNPFLTQIKAYLSD